ncbi:MAG: response regulator [Pirellulales bacterium]
MNDKSILLVDDDSDVLETIGARCRARGYQVLTAHNLLTAMSLTERRPPDLVCVDVELPTGNGLAFCETLSANPATKHIPVIVLTGHREAETLRRCQKLGATYVAKRPDVWTELEPLLDKLIQRKPDGTTSQAKKDGRTKSSVNNPQSAARLSSPKSIGNPQTGQPSLTPSPPFGARASKNQPLASCTIVIADDDVDLVDSLTQRCSQLGCRVIGASSALEAINAIHRVTPDLVCIDVNMPAGSGLSVCEMMSTDERLRSIPVIVLTGNSDHHTIRRCHDMMVYYVEKSVDVWQRIEPLLVELLAPAARGLAPETAPDREGDALLDAVFAMLGNSTESSDAAATDQQIPADAPPWVLCIDDDPDFSDALKCRLETYGVAVIRAFSGMEGYRLAFTHPASAILLDYNMPNGQGDYILGRLQDNNATRAIPVIIITGVRDKSLERKMYGLGAKRFLNKPVQFDALRNELANYIDILAEPVAV